MLRTDSTLLEYTEVTKPKRKGYCQKLGQGLIAYVKEHPVRFVLEIVIVGAFSVAV